MPKVKVNVGTVRTIIRLQVAPELSEADAKALYQQLDGHYESTMMASDDSHSLYRALVNHLEESGVTGDFNVDDPDFQVWKGNEQIM